MSDLPQDNVVDGVDNSAEQTAEQVLDQQVAQQVEQLVEQLAAQGVQGVHEVEPQVSQSVPQSVQVVPQVSQSVPQSVQAVQSVQVVPQVDQPVAPRSSPTAAKKCIPKPDDLRLNVDQVSLIMDCIKTVLDGRKPTPASMLRIVANCLQSSRRMKLKPDLAKKLITHAMEAFLRDPANELDEESIQLLMTCADLTIKEGIDVLDDVSKGKIDVKPGKCCIIV